MAMLIKLVNITHNERGRKRGGKANYLTITRREKQATVSLKTSH